MDAAGMRTLALRFPAARLHRTAIVPALSFPRRTRWRSPLFQKGYICRSQLSPPSNVSLTDRDEEGSRTAARVEAEDSKLLQVVLVSPQIAGNTGCIARTCAATAVGLHLVEPLGYKVEDAKLKRAGLDYWPLEKGSCRLSLSRTISFFVWNPLYFLFQEGEKRLLAFTKRGKDIHSDFKYRKGDWLVFGSETSGLPDEALKDCSEGNTGGGKIRIPMVETHVRCLNLSVSVGIALYEASRQLNYEQLHSSSPANHSTRRLFISEDIYA